MTDNLVLIVLGTMAFGLLGGWIARMAWEIEREEWEDDGDI